MNWPVAKITDVASVVSGGTPKSGIEEYWDGEVAWITPKDMGGKQGEIFVSNTDRTISQAGLDKSSAKLVPENSVILSTRAPIGHLVINTVPMAFNQGCRGLVPTKYVDVKYLYYFLHANVELLNNLGTGATFKELSKKALEDVEFPLPSVPEQKRIVSILDQAFADIDKARALTEQNLKNVRELFESYLQQVFSQRGEGWAVEPLENLVTNDCTLSYGIVQPGNDFENGLPVVRPTDLTREVIDLDGLKLIDPSKAEGYMRTVLQGGELLVCVRGSTGTTTIASEQLSGANVTRGIVPIRFNPERVSQRFGYYQFLSPLIQVQIQAGTYGAALTQINIRDLRKIEVTVPPLSVQNEIVNKLDRVKPDLLKVEKLYVSKLDAFDKLKKAFLQKAFSGELTKDSEEAAA